MPVTQDRLTRLREFGLSEYAARSYLALLDLGIAEARDVSSISKVPQAKIYHVLEQLHDKGLVVILPEFPKKYAPVPFEEYLGRLYEEHSKAARAIHDQRGELAEMFRVMGDTDVGDRGFFTVIRGRRNVLAKIEEMVGQTQKDLIVLGTAGTASRAAHLMLELRRARDRDVRIRFLAPVDAETIEKLEPLAELSDLRARELDEAEQSAKVAIVISDSARAFLIHFVPDDANLYAGKDIGVFTDQEAMVAAIQAIVEPHWTRATSYGKRRADLALAQELGSVPLQPADVGIGRLFGLVQEAVIVVDRAGMVSLWNSAAEAIFGLPAHKAVGTPFLERIAQADRAAVRARVERAGRAASAHEVAERLEAKAILDEGETSIELTIVGVDGGRGPHVLVVAREIAKPTSPPHARASRAL